MVVVYGATREVEVLFEVDDLAAILSATERPSLKFLAGHSVDTQARHS